MVNGTEKRNFPNEKNAVKMCINKMATHNTYITGAENSQMCQNNEKKKKKKRRAEDIYGPIV